MEIWFAKAEAVNVYAPVYVRIPTQYGMVTIWDEIRRKLTNLVNAWGDA